VDALRELAEGRLKGVMFHVANHNAMLAAGAKGMAALHAWQSMDEMRACMAITDLDIEKRATIPVLNFEPSETPCVASETPLWEVYRTGLALYYNYESGVMSQLMDMARCDGEDVPDVVRETAADVRQELAFISELQARLDKAGNDDATVRKIDDALRYRFERKLARAF
jgi:hypothetical protein